MLGAISNPSNSPVIVLSRIANRSKQVSDYAKELETTYDSMKLDKIGERMKSVSEKIDEQRKIAEEVNAIDQEQLNEFCEKLKEASGLGIVRYSARVFRETDQPLATAVMEPMIDLTE